MTLERAAAALERGRADGYHPGAQLVVHHRGEVVADLVIGGASPGVAMSSDTLLPWYSCTKAITAVAVLQQWERGRLTLDDRVADHVPEFAAGGKGEVKIRHVLTHTGGFRFVEGGLWRGDWETTVAAVSDAPLEDGWVPGQRAGYHDGSGFMILGEVVRRCDAAGRAFDAIVAEDIFEPLDMPDSWLALSPERFASYGDRMGVMYDTTTKADPRVLPGYEDGRAYVRVQPSGSGVGPMRDLIRFYDALAGGGALGGQRILSPQTVDAMTARHRVALTDETFGMIIDWGLGVLVNSFHYRGRPTSYGFGKHASSRTFGHGGRQSSLAFADPEHQLTVAICCNGMPGEPGNHRRTQPILTAIYEDLGLASQSSRSPVD